MFSLLNTALFSSEHDVSEERSAVPYPTPVTFPNHAAISVERQVAWVNDKTHSTDQTVLAPNFKQTFIGVKRLSDTRPEHWQLLNIRVECNCSLEKIVPRTSDGSHEYLPSKSWLQPRDLSIQPASEARDDHVQNSVRSLDSNNPLYAQSDKNTTTSEETFQLRVGELLLDNDTAIDAIRPGGRPRRSQNVKVVHFRSFWENVNRMRRYWDTSKDKYMSKGTLRNIEDSSTSDTASPPIEQNAGSADVFEPRKKLKQQHEASARASQDIPQDPCTISFIDEPPDAPDADGTPHTLRHTTSMTSRPKQETKASSQPSSLPKGTYKGYRDDNGAAMPSSIRADAVRDFVKTIAWEFGLLVHPHKKPTVLEIGTANLPVHITAAAWKAPAERDRARAGWVVGPAMGISARKDTCFSQMHSDSTGSDPRQSTSNNVASSATQQETNFEQQAEPSSPIADALHEIAAMLSIAAERRREGLVEVCHGADKWYATIPRWGGGAESDSARPPEGEENQPAQADASVRTKPRIRRRPNKPTPLETWKNVKPNSAVWDNRVQYTAIGRPDQSGPDAGWDYIFFVSSLNHHIAILKLRVHRAYVDYVTTGIFPSEAGLTDDWCKPVLQRTVWYDLLSPNDRAEAARGVWGMMAWLSRETV